MKKFFLLVLTYCLAMTAFAEDSAEQSSPAENPQKLIYGGINLGKVSFKTDGSRFLTPEFNIIGLKAGMHLHDYLDAEVRLSSGTSKDPEVVGRDRYSSELDYLAGAYLKPGIGKGIRLYGLLGFNQASISVSGPDPVVKSRVESVDSDLAMGFGLEVQVGDTMRINFECASYADSSSGELTGCSYGMATWF